MILVYLVLMHALKTYSLRFKILVVLAFHDL
jgi:hypothetical protein